MCALAFAMFSLCLALYSQSTEKRNIAILHLIELSLIFKKLLSSGKNCSCFIVAIQGLKKKENGYHCLILLYSPFCGET